jgi:tripartite-type tricarboxylate transporter receptor subunit TctC
MARAADVHMLHVPFKDTGALLTAVAAGEVDCTVIGINTVAGLLASGKLRPLAVAARQRLPTHPDIPTLVEAGGPAVVMHPWAGLVALTGTPPAVLSQLHQDIVSALGEPAVRSRAELAGFEITPSSPQALRERVAADLALYGPLVSEGRIARL